MNDEPMDVEHPLLMLIAAVIWLLVLAVVMFGFLYVVTLPGYAGILRVSALVVAGGLFILLALRAGGVS